MQDFVKQIEEKFFNGIDYPKPDSADSGEEYVNTINNLLRVHGDMLVRWVCGGNDYSQYITSVIDGRITMNVEENGKLKHTFSFKIIGLKVNFMTYINKYTKHHNAKFNGNGVWDL